MKKVIIRNVENHFIAEIDDVKPKLTDFKPENIVAAFDVSECFIHC